MSKIIAIVRSIVKTTDWEKKPVELLNVTFIKRSWWGRPQTEVRLVCRIELGDFYDLETAEKLDWRLLEYARRMYCVRSAVVENTPPVGMRDD